jgi:hypothetical protein
MKAHVTPQKFQELFNRFNNTYGDSLPPIVSYYRENDVVNVYMQFANVCWTTFVGVENASKYLSIFQTPIELQKAY